MEDARFWKVITGTTGWTGGLGGTPAPKTPVGPNGQLKLSQKDIDLPAHIIYAEAGAQPFLGQVAWER